VQREVTNERHMVQIEEEIMRIKLKIVKLDRKNRKLCDQELVTDEVILKTMKKEESLKKKLDGMMPDPISV